MLALAVLQGMIALAFMQRVAGNTSAKYALYIQWLQDHFLSNYSLSLTAVAKALIIRLPFGQDPNQIQTVMLRSNDATGKRRDDCTHSAPVESGIECYWHRGALPKRSLLLNLHDAVSTPVFAS